MAAKFQPTPAVPIEDLPGALPLVNIPEGTEPNAVLSSTIQNLQFLNEDQLYADAFWRDLLAFTGTFRTFHTPRTISTAWQELSARTEPSDFIFTPGTAQVKRFGPVGWIEGRFTFKTGGQHRGEGSGIIFIVPTEEQRWKVWLISTILESLDAFGNPDAPPSVTKLVNSATAATNGRDSRQDKEETATDVLIVGAGQNGICLAARLKALGVEAMALEKEDAVGANWTSRYDSVKLHTGKHFAHLPFEYTFAGDEYPYFLRGTDLAKGYRDYVSRYGIDVRLSTVVESVAWVTNSKSWKVHAVQHGKRWDIKAKHIVFATGAGGQQPKFPSVPAHDVAVDMVEAGLSSVTMVQRNPTPVLPARWFLQAHTQLYNEASIITESDRREYSLPLTFYRNLAETLMKKLATEEPEQFDSLEQAGFKVVRVPNPLKIMFERQGSHYLDVGGSQKIIDGEIRIKQGEIKNYVATGLQLADGSTLEADVVVFCTGFENNMRTMVESIVGPELLEQLDHHWYVDKEGEVRGAFKTVGLFN
ncbi:hypothetical protein ACJ41O_009060 [Fusarium nematophilum]